MQSKLSKISQFEIFMDYQREKGENSPETLKEYADKKHYTNKELVDHYEELFNTAYSLVSNGKKRFSDDVKLSNLVISSKEKGEGLEEKIYSFSIPYSMKKFSSYPAWLMYTNRDFPTDKDHEKEYRIKVHVAIDPKNFRELPILAGALAKYTDLHSEDMTFKIQTEPKLFEEWSDYSKYNKKITKDNGYKVSTIDTNSQAGKHIAIYFRNVDLAKEIIDTLMKERIKVAKSFYGDKMNDPNLNSFKRSYSNHEMSLSDGYLGITLRPYQYYNDYKRSPLRGDIRLQKKTFDNFFPSMIPFIKSWENKSKYVLSDKQI